MICIGCVGNESSKKPFLTFLKFGLKNFVDTSGSASGEILFE